MGYSGAQFDPEKVDLYFESAAGKLKIIENGVATGYSEEEATKILSEKAGNRHCGYEDGRGHPRRPGAVISPMIM